MYQFAAACRLIFVAVIAASSMILTCAATAWESDPDRNVVRRHGSIADLRLFDVQQRRDAFQQEQARFREVDRLRAAAPRRTKVPRLPRKCLPPPFGGDVLKSCR
jgi:hypothetical protein